MLELSWGSRRKRMQTQNNKKIGFIMDKISELFSIEKDAFRIFVGCKEVGYEHAHLELFWFDATPTVNIEILDGESQTKKD